MIVLLKIVSPHCRLRRRSAKTLTKRKRSPKTTSFFLLLLYDSSSFFYDSSISSSEVATIRAPLSSSLPSVPRPSSPETPYSQPNES